MILSPEELRELTGRRRSDAQRRELDRMGIRYGVRTDGSVVVLETAVNRALGQADTIRAREPELHL